MFKIKSLLLAMIFINLFSTYAQKTEISELENHQKQIIKEIDILNDSLKKIKSKISAIKVENIKKNVKDSLVITIRKTGKIRNKPSPNGEIVKVFSEDKQVILIGFEDDYFRICMDYVCGYISGVYVKESSKEDEFVKNYINVKKAEEEEIKRLKNQEKLKKEAKIAEAIKKMNLEWEEKLKKNAEEIEKEAKEKKLKKIKLQNKYKKKYGEKTYNKLKNGYYWIGMTKEMATISLGKPNDINKTVGSWGIHEQWVYDNIYLYFENGELTSYQN